MKRDWEANKARWSLQEEIEQETTHLKNLEDSLEYLQRPSQRQEREEKEQEIATKKILLNELKKSWTEKAAEEPRILALKAKIFLNPKEQEDAIARAIKRLEKEDKKINAFKEKLLFPEKEDDFAENTKDEQKDANYPAALKISKTTLLASYFQTINSERLNIQNITRSSKPATSEATKQQAKQRYDLLLPQEQAAVQRYQLSSEEQAMDAVIGDVADAAMAWSERSTTSTAAAARVDHTRKHPNTLHWEGSFEQSPQGLYLIAQADKAAWEAFERERKYMEDIQKTFKKELSLATEHALKREQTAAELHIQGDRIAWNMLNLEERNHYNHCMSQNAQEHLGDVEDLLENLLISSVKAIAKIKDVNEAYLTYYTQTTKQKVLSRAEEQEMELKRVIHLLSDHSYQETLDRALYERGLAEKDEKEEELVMAQGFSISLEKCDPTIIESLKKEPNKLVDQHTFQHASPEIDQATPLTLKNSGDLQRCCTIFQEELTRQIAIINQSKIAPLEEEAKQSGTAAYVTWNEAIKAQGEAKYPLWNQAIAEAERTALLWNRVFSAREEALKTIKNAKKEAALYDLETAQDKKEDWESEVAKIKVTQAESIAGDAQKKAAGIEGEAAASVWDQAIASLADVHVANEKWVSLANKRVAIVAARFQTAAKRDIEEALSAQATWKDCSIIWNASKADAMAKATWERLSFECHEIPEGTEQLLPFIKEAALAREKVVALNRDQLSKAEERFKIDWRRTLEQNDNRKIFFSLWENVLEAPNSQKKESAWKELLRAAGLRIKAMGALLEEGIKKGNFNYNNDLDNLQFQKTLADYNNSWCQSLRQGDAAHDAYEKWRERIELEESANMAEKGSPYKQEATQEQTWNEVLQLVEATIATWKASADKPSWRKDLRASKTQQALWEGRRSWWEAEKKEWEAKMAKDTYEKRFQDGTSSAGAAAGEGLDAALKTAWDEVIQLGNTTLAAWEQVKDLQWEKASHAPVHLKPLWLQNRDAADAKKKEWEQTLQLWKAKQN